MLIGASEISVFVAGTDTVVGKTVISSILVAGLDAYYWKPIQSGLDNGGDSEWVRRTTQIPAKRIVPETYRLTLPLSPHHAARHDGVRVDVSSILRPDLPRGSRLVVEGCGGLLVPLNESDLLIDLITNLGIPVILVARSTLGTINHTLLSLSALRSRGIFVLGVVLNGPLNKDNRDSIEQFGKARVLAEVPPIASFDPGVLGEAFERYFIKGEYNVLDELASMASVYPRQTLSASLPGPAR